MRDKYNNILQTKSHIYERLTDRLLYILDIKGITKYKFHKDLGFSNGFLDKSREIGTDKYAKILEYFPDINRSWKYAKIARKRNETCDRRRCSCG